MLKRWLREENGVTSIEYALIAALIAMVIVAAVQGVGVELQGLYNHVADEVNKAND
jgi:pilus assembly protein Flp/PilA